VPDPVRDETPVEREIRHEKARTLGKAGEELERACAEAWASFRSNADDYRAARDRALRRRHVLILQREAMGLFGHADVDRLYPLPPEEKPAGGR
jgi:hypothetical protein